MALYMGKVKISGSGGGQSSTSCKFSEAAMTNVIESNNNALSTAIDTHIDSTINTNKTDITNAITASQTALTNKITNSTTTINNHTDSQLTLNNNTLSSMLSSIVSQILDQRGSGQSIVKIEPRYGGSTTLTADAYILCHTSSNTSGTEIGYSIYVEYNAGSTSLDFHRKYDYVLEEETHQYGPFKSGCKIQATNGRYDILYLA